MKAAFRPAAAHRSHHWETAIRDYRTPASRCIVDSTGAGSEPELIEQVEKTAHHISRNRSGSSASWATAMGG
jgi:hypothetical protein